MLLQGLIHIDKQLCPQESYDLNFDRSLKSENSLGLNDMNPGSKKELIMFLSQCPDQLLLGSVEVKHTHGI